MKNALAAVTVALALAALAGCRARPPVPPVVTYRTAHPDALLVAHNQNAARIETLSARLDMVLFYSDNGRERRQRLAAWLDAQRPGRLRLRHDAVGRDLFLIVSDGEEFWIGLDRALSGDADTVYTGDFDSLDEITFLRPDRLLGAFSLWELPPPDAADVLPEIYRERYVLASITGARPRRLLSRATFSRVDLRLRRYEVFDAEGRLALDVEYQSYQTVSDAYVPSLLLIRWPLDDIAIQAAVRDVTLNESMPDRLWQFAWRPGYQLVNLGPPRPFPAP